MQSGGPRHRRPAAAVVALAVVLGLAACGPGGVAGRGRPVAGTADPTAAGGDPTTTAPPAADPAAPALIVTPGRDLPDPFVLPVPGGYVLYASQDGFFTPPVQLATSSDLTSWGPAQPAMTTEPPWATFGFTWSPDVRKVAGRYVLYYDALASPALYQAPGQTGLAAVAQCIGTATATSPFGPFEPQAHPLVCQFDHHGAIDPRTFRAPGGALWLDWKSDDNAGQGADPEAVTHLFAQRLSPDGLQLVGAPSQLMAADAPWQDGGRLVEAPDMVYAEGVYWLFYSGGWYNEPGYGMGVARCAGPAGPCTDLSVGGPWLGSNAQGQGPGEGSLFEDTAGRTWLVYSPWYAGEPGESVRPVAMARVAFGPLGPYLARP